MSALIVVDVQRAFDDASVWGQRNNPDCEQNVGRLIEAWRAKGEPIVFVRHDSEEAGSSLGGSSMPGPPFPLAWDS